MPQSTATTAADAAQAPARARRARRGAQGGSTPTKTKGADPKPKKGRASPGAKRPKAASTNGKGNGKGNAGKPGTSTQKVTVPKVTPEPCARTRARSSSGKVQRITPGFTVTGVRIDERLSPKLMALARLFGSREGVKEGRTISLTSIAVKAMRRYAERHGIALADPGDMSASRRDDVELEEVRERRLWIKYPEAWADGLEELRRALPILNHAADVWRIAIFELAQAEGVEA